MSRDAQRSTSPEAALRALIADGEQLVRESRPHIRKHLLELFAKMRGVLDLYAPMDDEGVRHPEDGFITREQLRKILDMPEPVLASIMPSVKAEP